MNDHTLIRATLVSAIVTILAAHWGVAPDEAMRRFYSSKTAVALADDSTGLYGCSALNIAGACVSELDGEALSPQGKLTDPKWEIVTEGRTADDNVFKVTVEMW